MNIIKKIDKLIKRYAVFIYNQMVSFYIMLDDLAPDDKHIALSKCDEHGDYYIVRFKDGKLGLLYEFDGNWHDYINGFYDNLFKDFINLFSKKTKKNNFRVKMNYDQVEYVKNIEI